MRRIKVLHQVLDPSGIGGVSSEYKALQQSALTHKYEFSSMILMKPHKGLNIRDIFFYYKRIKQEKPDIVHIRGAAIDGLNAVIAAWLYRKAKIYVAVHGMYSDIVYISPFKKWISKHFVEGITFGLADGISCVCGNVTNRTYFDKYRKKMLPFVYNRMPKIKQYDNCTVRSAVRLQYGIGNEAIVALFLGRMTIEKGIDDMFAALDMTSLPRNFVLLMVGDGDYYEAAKCIASEKKYKVIFTGSQAEVMRFYLASDFFIMPSLHENHSISLLEACAAGIPSVATDCGGNNETIEDGLTGFIVSVGRIDLMSNAIEHLLDADIRNRLKANLQSYDFSRFSDDSCDTALDKSYQALLNRYGLSNSSSSHMPQ